MADYQITFTMTVVKSNQTTGARTEIVKDAANEEDAKERFLKIFERFAQRSPFGQVKLNIQSVKKVDGAKA